MTDPTKKPVETVDLAAALGIEPEVLLELNLAQQVALIRATKESLKEKLELINEADRQTSAAMLDYLTDSSLEKVRTAATLIPQFAPACQVCGHKQELPPVRLAATTVYPAKQLWARLTENSDAAFEALRRAGLGDYIKQTVNTQSLSAFFREESTMTESYKVPDYLEPYVKISTSFEVRTRRS